MEVVSEDKAKNSIYRELIVSAVNDIKETNKLKTLYLEILDIKNKNEKPN